MFRVLQFQTSNSKTIFSRNDSIYKPFLHLSRSLTISPLKKQRVFTRHKVSTTETATETASVCLILIKDKFFCELFNHLLLNRSEMADFIMTMCIPLK